MPYSNWMIISSTRRAPASVASISIGVLLSKRRFGFLSHRQAFSTSWNARSAIVVTRATRTALSDSSLESRLVLGNPVRQSSAWNDQLIDLSVG